MCAVRIVGPILPMLCSDVNGPLLLCILERFILNLFSSCDFLTCVRAGFIFPVRMTFSARIVFLGYFPYFNTPSQILMSDLPVSINLSIRCVVLCAMFVFDLHCLPICSSTYHMLIR